MDKSIAVITSLLLTAASTAYAGDLQVTLGQPKLSAAQDVDVAVTYRNTGKQVLHVYRWYVPEKDLKEQFLAVSIDGKPAEYLGPRYKRVAPSLRDTVALAPGAALTAKVRVSDYYDLSRPGQLQVRFEDRSARVLNSGLPAGVSAKQASAPQDEAVSSNAVGVYSGGHVSPLLNQARSAKQSWAIQSRAAVSGVSYAANCSVSQQNQSRDGVVAAGSMADETSAYLNGSPSASPRYVTWFGKFSQANWNTAKSHYVKIKDALDAKPIKLDCSCTDAGTFAYVYPAQPYTIYLCGAFWTAPTKGTDSKGGTLVHELSHFTVVAGTSDHVYGQAGAKNLAKTNPTQALGNADNHEYFAENTPSQP
ncbi:M35 family metallo-endopeptidase [Chromobacterium sp. IIBBL 290-4]|uniref:M35 family metallo-endopeptidase n=1 Tax=Chromobacterium sp. IIBBL 290-4 TaxID=2953890 RepID=UPI0020B832A1|nr:M35 family metallo-endopeptidase [Chromobacterium sp. IIBBL 290-4]UTH72599.1 M35 family metallo-endopeptidase [Chromobacterium sp. IIBBL 290-4]